VKGNFMRKRIFTKQIGVTLTEDTLKKIIESTTQNEVSISAWVRDVIETKLSLEASSQNNQPELQERRNNYD
jgi:hypothetical protein